jgi:DNA-directed RNA polymerase specialized sigma24 family protein/predicted DNA-binding transcriptional regulator AlpA
MRNSYEGVLDDWKVDLIRQRAKQHRVRLQDMPDIEQEVALTLLALDYDEENEAGASERTFLTEVIDRRLHALLRKERRYRDRVGDEGKTGLPERSEPDARLQQTDVVDDVQRVMAALDTTDRSICTLLSESASVHAIAEQLGLGWHSVQRRIDSIRDRLQNRGLDGWLVTNGDRATDDKSGSPLLISARHAASMCGRSERTWRTWDSAGLIPQPVRIGRSTLWRQTELQAWIAAGCPCREDWEVRRQNAS